MWQKLGLEEIVDEMYRRSPIEVPVKESLLCMVTNRPVDPRSKLGTLPW